MSLRIVGSAFLVAPGVAISATHVLERYFPDIESGAVVIYGVGILEASASLWSVEKLYYNCSDDIFFISVVPFTETPSHRTFFQFGLTTRCPHIGENLHLVGFRDFGSTFSDTENPEGAFRANMLISAGSVTAVYPEKRDSVLMPFPTIEIGSGSTGGMSGGVALTSDGKVVGVISRGLSTDDHQGPTFVSWIINCLNRPLEITWPRGLYSEAHTNGLLV